MPEDNEVRATITSATSENVEDFLQTIIDEVGNWENPVQSVSVSDVDLQPLYMKIQKKTTLGSEQRIENGIVRFTVTANVQIAKVRGHVQRCSDWIAENFFGYFERGRSEVHTRVVRQEMTNYYYECNLDSVYCTEKGAKVYELEKNKGEDVNNWMLFIAIELIDQSTEEFVYGPFRLITKPSKKSQSKSEEDIN